jgi:hypothetical protein
VQRAALLRQLLHWVNNNTPILNDDWTHMSPVCLNKSHISRPCWSLQERLVWRAALLLQLLRWVNKTFPGLMDPDTIQQVEAAAAGLNPVNPAVDVLLVPQLTQLAAAVYPWGVLCGTVESAVAAATEALMKKVRLSFSP